MSDIATSSHEAIDVRQFVAGVLRALGDPPPPLNLDDVREVLRLDRRYFGGSDCSAVDEMVSGINVAGKQLFRRPQLLVNVVKKAKLSALWIPEKRRILIDETRPKLKHRWSEAHEIGHSIIPWHAHLLLGDNEFSLHPACHAQLESEANYAAGQLLFLQGQFAERACCSPVGISAIQSLRQTFRNTLSSTLWRYVEELGDELPLVGLITVHPHRRGDVDDQKPDCRHFIRSGAFRSRFSGISSSRLYSEIARYCGRQSGGPLGEAELVLPDDSSDEHLFHFESFCNGYDVLTLGRYLRRRFLSA